jgi:hypothetical protein
MSTREQPPIGSDYWRRERPNAIGIWNAQYLPNGKRIEFHIDEPWSVDMPDHFERFATHAEALAFALKEAATA